MLLLKQRTKSKELSILELLNKRMDLSRKDKLYYLNLKKGLEGELQFDTFIENLQCKCYLLNDLLFEINHTTFQIDSLLIAQRNIYIYEIKNYGGDYYYESDKLYKKPRKEIPNPLHQVGRSEVLLSQLLLKIGAKAPIEPSVVFINPDFTLYHSPMDKPIIFFNQIKRHMKELNANPSTLTEKHREIADQLMELHIEDSTYKNIPAYNYQQLRKGITCKKCHNFSIRIKNRISICKVCGFEEPRNNGVIRIAEEYKILFPDQKLTTNIIHDMCQGLLTKDVIRYTLKQHYNMIGVRQWAYYE